ALNVSHRSSNAARASGLGPAAAGGAKAASFRGRMSVRRHSSSRALGQGKARNRANASPRRSTSHQGSSRPFTKRGNASSVNRPVVGLRIVPVALLIIGEFVRVRARSLVIRGLATAYSLKKTIRPGSPYRAFHLELDELVHLDGVFHGQLLDQRLDE